MQNKMPLNILVFAPFQAIEQHTFPEAYFTKLLRDDGHSITYLGCDGLLNSYCVSQAAFGLAEASSDADKAKVCITCIKQRKIMGKIFPDKFLLENYYNSSFEIEISKFLSSIQRAEQIPSLIFKDISLGRIAAYEFIIHNKISDILALSDEQLRLYKIYLANAMRTLFCIEEFFKSKKFDRVFLYNSAYSTNNVVLEVARKNNIPLCFMHAAFNLQHRSDSMYFSWKKTIEYDREVIGFFEKNSDALNLDYSKYEIPLDHIRHQLTAKSVFTYSSGRRRNLVEVKNKLNIDDDYEKIVLASMSSFDESYATDFSIMNGAYLGAATKIFPSQIIWIQKLIEFFKNKPNIKLIIRVHPREFPNKREGTSSPRVRDYEVLFKDLPKNISIDYPSLKNSIYDLFEIIDLHLVSQTTTGCESAIFGIPGISYIKGIGNYPIQAINPVPGDEVEYFKHIETMLNSNLSRSIEIAKKSFEWYLFLHTKAAIFFNTNDYWNFYKKKGLFKRIFYKLKNYFGFGRYSLSKYLKNTKITAPEEKIFLNFFVNQKELIHTRALLEDKKNYSDEFFKMYIRDLFAAYYQLDLGDCRHFFKVGEYFRNMANATGICLLVISDTIASPELQQMESGGHKLILPARSKFCQLVSSYLTGGSTV